MILATIYALAALASGCAAVLAWIAKIRWANEYKEAKEAQIQQWKDMASTQLLAEFRASKELWEEISKVRNDQIDTLKLEIQASKVERGYPLAQGVDLADEMEAMRDSLELKLHEHQAALEKALRNLPNAPRTISLRGTGTVHPAVASSTVDPTFMVEAEREKGKSK